MPRFRHLIASSFALLLLSMQAASAWQADGEVADGPATINIRPFGIVSQATEMQGWSGTGWNALHLAVIKGDMSIAGAYTPGMVNAGDTAGLTPLHYAIAVGNLAVVNSLLQQGADVNASGWGGFSPLHAACQFGDLQMVQRLLDGGADVRRLYRGDWQWLSDGVLADNPAELRSGMEMMLASSGWDAGISCLHLAAASGNAPLVSLLLQNGLDPSLPTLMNSVTPLHLCVDSQECTALLLDAGAEVDPVEDFSGQTPLLGGTYEVCATLLEYGADPDRLNSWGYGRLHTVESTAMANLMLDHGADIELRGAYGETPLISAADRNLVQVAQLLLERGADVNACDYMARTALDRAVDGGHAELAKLLSEAGGEGGFDLHPFHFTAAQGSDSIIELALDAGEDVNGTDGCGWTALHYASMAGQASTVELLLSRGADVNARGVGGATALSCGALSPTELVKDLLDAGAAADAFDPWFGTPLLRACSRGDNEVAALLLRAGADPDTTDAQGNSALMLAADTGIAVIISQLIEKGASLDKRDSQGRTALMHALAASNYYGESCARQLIEAGADVNAVDSMQWGSLHHLALRGSVPLASKLIETGAQPDAVDGRGYTPARLARLAGNEILAGWLETAR
ncbi:MAG: ankyrin repeat domain-containing protein [Planctomycetales bacterium]|nr:ankyrin repeat domain-containing protein [bacterium]UNM07335.1 MAG: ankyrin repeat domain-containing protein [Planctomycetales bacterium]